MKHKSQFLICECHSHALLVEKFEDEDELNLSLFERGLDGRKLSIKERFRWCWQILRYGHPWSDHIILSKDNQKVLRKFLEET